MMSCGIARGICFRLHDAATDASGGEIVHDDFADQETSELDGVFWKLGAANPANGEFRAGFVESVDGRERRERGHTKSNSVRQNFLEVGRRNQILIFAILA